MQSLCAANYRPITQLHLVVSLLQIYLPHTHSQVVKQLVLSVVVTKIARSLVLAICGCCNYHQWVDNGEKVVSVFIELLTMAH